MITTEDVEEIVNLEDELRSQGYVAYSEEIYEEIARRFNSRKDD